MISNLKNQGSTIVLVLLFACLLYAGLIVWGSTGDWASHLSNLSIGGLGWVMVLVSLGYLLRFARWEFYMREMGFNVPLNDNLRIFLSSFLMAISPGKVGEAAKSYFLKEEFNVPATPTVAAFFCERFTDVLSMTLLASLGLLVYPKGIWLMLSIVLLQAIVLVGLQFPDFIERWLFEPLSGMNVFEHWVGRFRRFYDRSSNLLSLKNLLIGTGLGFLSWGIEGICLGIILRDLGFFSLTYPLAVFVFSASVLLGAAAMLPGGIGSSEALMIGMLLYFGAERNVAVSATVIVRLVTLWYGVLLGAICWLWSWQILRGLEKK